MVTFKRTIALAALFTVTACATTPLDTSPPERNVPDTFWTDLATTDGYVDAASDGLSPPSAPPAREVTLGCGSNLKPDTPPPPGAELLVEVFFVELPDPFGTSLNPVCGAFVQYIVEDGDETRIEQRRETFDDTEMARRIAKAKAARQSDDALVHIHGHNDSAADALARVIDFSRVSQFGATPIIVGWPVGTQFKYGATNANRQTFSAYAGRVLSDLSAMFHGGNRALWAHSQGAALTLNALGDYARERPPLSPLLFDTLVLEAPDVSLDLIDQDKAAFSTVGRTSLYCAGNDRALGVFARWGDAIRSKRDWRGPRLCTDVEQLVRIRFTAPDIEIVMVDEFIVDVNSRPLDDILTYSPQRVAEPSPLAADEREFPPLLGASVHKANPVAARLSARFANIAIREAIRWARANNADGKSSPYNHTYFVAELSDHDVGAAIIGTPAAARSNLKPAKLTQQICTQKTLGICTKREPQETPLDGIWFFTSRPQAILAMTQLR